MTVANPVSATSWWLSLQRLIAALEKFMFYSRILFRTEKVPSLYSLIFDRFSSVTAVSARLSNAFGGKVLEILTESQIISSVGMGQLSADVTRQI